MPKLTVPSGIHVGAKFERLTVIEEPRREQYYDTGYPRWKCWCQCECGAKLDVWTAHLLSGNTGSCGCLQKERTGNAARTHGFRRELLYDLWIHMRGRCQNQKDIRYENYGGRGISVCKEWDDDYLVFRAWALANGYEQGLTIERKNNDGNYEPNNCTWIPRGEQRRNTRNNHHVTAFGETKLLQDWSNDPRCKVRRLTIYQRLKAGWDAETAITMPAQTKGSTSSYIRVKKRRDE